MFLELGFFILFIKICYSRVPAVCLAKPRWDDCGRTPTPVMYYYKPASRCEVGIWRGCYPNLNMFKDEYECVAKCVFGSRAESEDYHSHINDIYDRVDDSIVTDAALGNDSDGTTPAGVDITSISSKMPEAGAGIEHATENRTTTEEIENTEGENEGETEKTTAEGDDTTTVGPADPSSVNDSSNNANNSESTTNDSSATTN